MEDQLTAFLHFLAHERNYSDNTIAAYRNDLGQFLSWLEAQSFDVGSWANITDEHVEDYASHLRQQSYTASSVARKVAAIKSFFHYLLARGRISDDPTVDLDSPKVKKRLPKTLSLDEIERLLAAPFQRQSPKNLRDAALLYVLYTTGMRVTEAVSLTLDDVDLESGTLDCEGKDGQVRELPIDDTTRQVLAEYLESGRPHLVKDKDETALFLNHRGQQLTRQGLWLIIKSYANQADLGDKVTPHTLRHSFAAHQLDSGTELREVQHLLGHANISTTQIYSHLVEDSDRD
ncbi:MAG: site-specific tyrosine recombinase XerD [Candidatus Promineifilaceae bacterium]|nr:site-specific tyrosine recombinase XerD [Candidatus Promineifilaceae bacterium]